MIGKMSSSSCIRKGVHSERRRGVSDVREKEMLKLQREIKMEGWGEWGWKNNDERKIYYDSWECDSRVGWSWWSEANEDRPLGVLKINK